MNHSTDLRQGAAVLEVRNLAFILAVPGDDGQTGGHLETEGGGVAGIGGGLLRPLSGRHAKSRTWRELW